MSKPTDAEVEAAAKIVFDNVLKTRHWSWVASSEPGRAHYRVIARAALEAAAALRQPREGAGGDEHTQDEWASLRRELDSVAEERDVYRQACGRTREGLQRDLDATEAALAESWGEAGVLRLAFETRIRLAIGRIERGESGAALTGLRAALDALNEDDDEGPDCLGPEGDCWDTHVPPCPLAALEAPHEST